MSLVPEMENELMQSFSASEEEEFYGMEYGCNIKTCVQEGTWNRCGRVCRRCEAAVQVKVAVHQERVTFRKAVVVVVALEKMKLAGLGRSLFSDFDLSEIFNSILEEDNVHMHTFEETTMAEQVYRHFDSHVYQIADKDHKDLWLNEFSGEAHLVALHLQGENAEHKVALKMASYAPQKDINKKPVTLAINGRTLYLSCLMVSGQPELRLEVYNENMLKSIKSDLLRFLFFKVEESRDRNLSTFESTACPGWFISTSQSENEKVTVTNVQNDTAIHNFRPVKS